MEDKPSCIKRFCCRLDTLEFYGNGLSVIDEVADGRISNRWVVLKADVSSLSWAELVIVLHEEFARWVLDIPSDMDLETATVTDHLLEKWRGNTVVVLLKRCAATVSDRILCIGFYQANIPVLLPPLRSDCRSNMNMKEFKHSVPLTRQYNFHAYPLEKIREAAAGVVQTTA
jgi:hypothetical protein